MLERLGCAVDIAVDGLDALRMLEANPYDIVFMDCQMPRMDGYEATREIRRREAQGRTRTTIVALTAHALPGDRERCLDAGMDDFLAKPVRKETIFEMVERHLPGKPEVLAPADTD
jgi:CheY-like chemotaxis protein